MGCLVHGRVAPCIKFAVTHLSTWLERGTVRVKCLVQEHNTMFPTRARTRTGRSEGGRTNNEATAPPLYIHVRDLIFIFLNLLQAKVRFPGAISYGWKEPPMTSKDWWRSIIWFWIAHLYWNLIQAFHDQQPYRSLKCRLSLGVNLCIQTHSIFAKQVTVRTHWETTYKFNIFRHVK